MHFEGLPTPLLEYLIDFLPQKCTLALGLTSITFQTLCNAKLYKKIYLSDSMPVNSTVYEVSRAWSCLKIAKNDQVKLKMLTLTDNYNNDDVDMFVRKQMEQQLRKLINTLETNAELSEYVEELWIDQDLSQELQIKLVLIIMKNSMNLKAINSVLNSEMMRAIVSCANWNRLQTLEIPPENTLPSIVSENYLQEAGDLFYDAFSEQKLMDSFAVFANPIDFCNNIEISDQDFFEQIRYAKLRVKKLTYHVRGDIFGNTNGSKFTTLSEIFDKDYLESFRLICWVLDERYSNEVFNENIWRGFNNIKDVNFVSMTIDESSMVKFLSNEAMNLKRFRFHYKIPRQKMIDSSSGLVRSLIKYQNTSLRFIDINFYDEEQEFFWYNVFESTVEFSQSHKDCKDCQYTKNVIIQQKVFKDNLQVADQNEFDNKNLVHLIFRKGLLPFTFSFDVYPCFSNTLKIVNTLNSFNKRNATAISVNDLSLVHQTLVHHMEPSLKFFMTKFPKLQSLVLNDIPFVVKDKRAFSVFELQGP